MNSESALTNSSGARQDLEITIYNEDLALVKDVRNIDVPRGISSLRFSDIAAKIDPTSVSFRSLTSPGLVRVLEQNYEFDVVSDYELLRRYAGEKVLVTTCDGSLYEGYVLNACAESTQKSLVLGESPDGGRVWSVLFQDIRVIEFPELPGGLVTRPSLAWTLENNSEKREHRVEVSYLTSGISWKADYVAVVSDEDNALSLTGWVTVNNQSGASYPEARLKLVAGDVHRVKERPRYLQEEPGLVYSAPEPKPQFTEEGLFEYHLYTLKRMTTIRNNQIKQIEFLTSENIPAIKLFVYNGLKNGSKVNVMIEFENAEDSGLGMPLPKGKVRVAKADSQGSLQFVGEDSIDHTPKDEKVRLYLGNAFDIVGERTPIHQRKPSSKIREEAFRIVIRSHKDVPVKVHVVEPTYWYPEWEILNSTHEFTRVDAATIETIVEVPPNDKATVEYTIRYRW